MTDEKTETKSAKAAPPKTTGITSSLTYPFVLDLSVFASGEVARRDSVTLLPKARTEIVDGTALPGQIRREDWERAKRMPQVQRMLDTRKLVEL